MASFQSDGFREKTRSVMESPKYIDTELICRLPEDKSTPVWDSYIEKIIIRGYIPSFISVLLATKINNRLSVPVKFSNKPFQGEISNIIRDTSVEVYRRHGLTYTKLSISRHQNNLVIGCNDRFNIYSEYKWQ